MGGGPSQLSILQMESMAAHQGMIEAAYSVGQQMQSPVAQTAASNDMAKLYDMLMRSAPSSFHELETILQDMHKRLQVLEGDRVTHPDGKEFVRIDDHWMPANGSN